MFSQVNRAIFVYFTTRFHLYIHAYSLLLIGRGLNLLQISVIESVVIGAIFVMEIPTGVIADRIGRRWSVTTSVVFLMMAEFLFLFSRSYPMYLFIATLTGTGFAFVSGAMESLIYDSLPEDNREERMKRTMGRYTSWGQIAFFFSPIVGGLIITDLQPWQFDLSIMLTVAVLFIGFLTALTLKEPATGWETGRKGMMGILREGWSALAGNPRLQRFVLVIILTAPFTGTLIGVLAAPHMNHNEVPPTLIGLALSAGSLIAAVMQHNAYRIEQWLGKRWGLAMLTLLPGISYLVLALITGPYWVWGMVVWMYATNDIRAPLVSAYQNTMISSKSRATALSLINMFMQLYIATVAPIYGAISTRSVPLVFVAMGLVILSASVLFRVDKVRYITHQ